MRFAKNLVVLFFVGSGVSFLFAQQSTPYILTDFPISLIMPDSAIWIKWTGAARPTVDAPDSATIYYSRSPGGSILENYADSVTIFESDIETNSLSANSVLFSGIPPQRGSKFIPENNGMEAGVYYVIVAFSTTVGLLDTTFVSNEIQVIIEVAEPVELLSPADLSETDALTPTFQWKKNAGVPYYHIIVSDEKINIDMDGAIEGLSIVWQAITVDNQIVYGAPDPSGTITADPPPLSPGKEYSWVVLNNYGNNMAFTSTKIGLPSSFTVAGEALRFPINVSPIAGDTLNSNDNDTISLQWRNLDPDANTYKIYIYVTQYMENIGAQMVVWSKEVTAAQFIDENNPYDTTTVATVKINAADILTENFYTWKVMAIDDKGAGTSGDTTGFRYESPTGTILVRTKENIESGSSTITKNVGLVEVKVEVLDGSLEAPLLFYTDQNGYLRRERPVGTYKLTTIKDGFENQTRNISIEADETNQITFYLKRPDATIFGKVEDQSGLLLNLATVIAVSDKGDTVSVKTDPLGNYVLNCYEADWTIKGCKDGYVTSIPFDTSVVFGQSVEIKSPIVLELNSYTLSGNVLNESGDALIGVKVDLYCDGSIVSTISSTPQSGAFSFSVEPGSYIIKTYKTGFSSTTKQIEMVESKSVTLVMSSGASLVTGVVYGLSWNDNDQAISSPITLATVMLIDTLSGDTSLTTTGAAYGEFNISVIGNRVYELHASKSGFTIQDSIPIIDVGAGVTVEVSTNLQMLAVISGAVGLTGASSDLSLFTVNIIDTVTNEVVASGHTDAAGLFEIRNIPDYSNGQYLITAGKTGFVIDTVTFVDKLGTATVGIYIRVNNGKAMVDGLTLDSVHITMVSGSKSLEWILLNGGDLLTDAKIKMKSPLSETFNADEVLAGVGIGTYLVSVDADHDSIIDISSHQYILNAGADSNHVDTITMALVHLSSDSVVTSSSGIDLSVSVEGSDSVIAAKAYYKLLSSTAYDSVIGTFDGTDGAGRKKYLFSINPRGDDCYVEYYFCMTLDNGDIYGYSHETFKSFVSSNADEITRLSVSPSSEEDTLLFSANSDVTFVFSGYYGSKYSKAYDLTNNNVDWNIIGNDYGCVLNGSDEELSVIIRTASAGTNGEVVTLQAKFKDDSKYKLAMDKDSVVIIKFVVLSKVIDSIVVTRIDASTKGYITTSTTAKAEFSASGLVMVDSVYETVSITPKWEVRPTTAGTLINGVFRPANDFLGRAQIIARYGPKIGKYYDATDEFFGLAVHYLIPIVKDTVSFGDSCLIILPDNVVSESNVYTLSLESPELKNKIFHGSNINGDYVDTNLVATGKIDVIGQVYDIEDIDGKISFKNSSTDSIVIYLTIPKEFQAKAKETANRFFVALWVDSVEQWHPLKRSKFSDSGDKISLTTTHFSRYAVVYRSKGTNAKFTVSPNPFSPLVAPEDAPNHYGTCFLVVPYSDKDISLTIEIDVRNPVGVKVWSVQLQGASSGREIRVWWDGRTTDNRVVALDTKSDTYGASYDEYYNFLSGLSKKRMCRNGRYLAVLTVSDTQRKEQYIKQVILVK